MATGHQHVAEATPAVLAAQDKAPIQVRSYVGAKKGEQFGAKKGEEFGGEEGKEWNDGTHSSIREINVRATEDTLTSIQFNYGLQGTDQLFRGPTHGGSHGELTTYILDPDEYLENMSGYFAKLTGGPAVIKSLMFATNKRLLGPFGAKKETYFPTQPVAKIVGLHGHSHTEGGGCQLDVRGYFATHGGRDKIVGFYGRASSAFLYSIGFYKNPLRT